jgi:uncharacterized OB-fold protein
MDFLVGLLIVAAMIFVLSRPFRKRSSEEVDIYRRLSGLDGEAERRIPCPHCAKPVLPEAKVCRHCGSDIELPRP